VKTKGSLDTERGTRLDKLGDWECSNRSRGKYLKWESNYELLCKFYEREGHCDVTTRHVENETKLEDWLKRQRD